MKHMSELPQQLRDDLRSALAADNRAESVRLVHEALDGFADQRAARAAAYGKPGG